MRSILSGFRNVPRATRSCAVDAVPPQQIGCVEHAGLLVDGAPGGGRSHGDEEVDRGAGLGFGRASKNGLKSNGHVLPRGAAESGAYAPDCDALTLVTVVRPTPCAEDGADDYWLVEVPRAATVAQVKGRIAELYGVPEEEQLLQLTADRGGDGAALPDALRLPEFLAQRPVYLLPAAHGAATGPEQERALRELRAAAEERALRELQVAARESAAAQSAMAESLRHVAYRVRFVRPEAAGGKVREKSIWLTLDALLPVEQVYFKVEEGMDSDHPLFLTFNGRLLPHEVPLHFTGVADGDTVIAAWEPPLERSGGLYGGGDDETDSENSFDAGMQDWAAS